MTGVDSLPDAKADAKPNAKPNPAEQMLSIVSANYELCHTSERIPVVVSNDDGKRRTFILPDNEFEGIVAKKLFDRFKIIPKSAQINDAFRLVEAYCLEGPCRPVHTRIGNHDGAVYFDLGDDSLRVVKITGKGWTIEATCPILFNRGPNISPMPTPERGGTVAELRPLLNVTDTDWLWVFAYLLAVLNPHGPFPHLILTGKSGSTKSTLARFIVGLIDSTWDEKREREELFEAPKNSEDLLIYGISSWLLAFDNMGMLPDKLSDALCRLATGGAYITRRLYTNNGLAKMSCQQPTVLTMVEDLVEKADLRTRCVFVALQKLAPESMEGERSLQEKFNSLRPRIMGALFDCVSCALGKFEATRPAPGNRMADMTRWCIAAEPATGLPPGTFANLFTPRVPEKTLDDGLRLLAAEGAKLRPKEIVERLNTLGVTDLPEPTALGMLLGKKRLDGVTISKGGKYWRFSLAD